MERKVVAMTAPGPQVFVVDVPLGCGTCCDSCVMVLVLVVSPDGIVSYFKKQVGPASVTLTDEEQFQKFISEKDASVVGEVQP